MLRAVEAVLRAVEVVRVPEVRATAPLRAAVALLRAAETAEVRDAGLALLRAAAALEERTPVLVRAREVALLREPALRETEPMPLLAVDPVVSRRGVYTRPVPPPNRSPW